MRRLERLITGEESMDKRWPKAEKDKEVVEASSSSDTLIETEEWLRTTLFPFFEVQHSRSSLRRVSQNSWGLLCFLPSPVSLVWPPGAVAVGAPGRKWTGKPLAREISTSRVCLHTTGAAWGCTEIEAEDEDDFFPPWPPAQWTRTVHVWNN